MQQSSEAILKLCELARSEFDAMLDGNKEALHVRKVARGLCELDGHDPDLIMMGYERQPLAIGAKGVAALLHAYPLRPQWALYVGDAKRAIEVLENAEAKGE